MATALTMMLPTTTVETLAQFTPPVVVEHTTWESGVAPEFFHDLIKEAMGGIADKIDKYITEGVVKEV